MTDLYTMAPKPGTFRFVNYGPDEMCFGIHMSSFGARCAAEQNTTRPWEYEPRPLTWQEREQLKFDEGIYQPLPWVNEVFWLQSHHIWRDHFAHISIEDPTKIAFTENEQKGERDIQLRMKPGKYLQRFFGDKLEPKQIAFYAEWFAKGDKPAADRGEIKFATTEEAIKYVYMNGPQSCMKHEHSGVEVYAAGDLAIAYVEDETRAPKSTVVSRALCWPDKKVFGRVYPTPDQNWSTDGWSSHDEACEVQRDLFNRLRAMGWKSLEEGGSFNGARLLNRTNCYGSQIGPYLDNSYGTRYAHPGEDDSFLYMANTGYNFDADYTDGTMCGGDTDESGETWTCDRCDDTYGEDDSQYTYYTSWNPQLGAHDERYYCSWCNDHQGFRCEATDANYTDSGDQVEVWMNGDWAVVHVDWADLNSFECHKTGDRYHNDYKVAIHDPDYPNEPDLYSSNNIEYFHCSYDGKNYLMETQSTKWPGFPTHYDSRSIRHSTRRKHAPQ